MQPARLSLLFCCRERLVAAALLELLLVGRGAAAATALEALHVHAAGQPQSQRVASLAAAVLVDAVDGVAEAAAAQASAQLWRRGLAQLLGRTVLAAARQGWADAAARVWRAALGQGQGALVAGVAAEVVVQGGAEEAAHLITRNLTTPAVDRHHRRRRHSRARPPPPRLPHTPCRRCCLPHMPPAPAHAAPQREPGESLCTCRLPPPPPPPLTPRRRPPASRPLHDTTAAQLPFTLKGWAKSVAWRQKEGVKMVITFGHLRCCGSQAAAAGGSPWGLASQRDAAATRARQRRGIAGAIKHSTVAQHSLRVVRPQCSLHTIRRGTQRRVGIAARVSRRATQLPDANHVHVGGVGGRGEEPAGGHRWPGLGGRWAAATSAALPAPPASSRAPGTNPCRGSPPVPSCRRLTS